MALRVSETLNRRPIAWTVLEQMIGDGSLESKRQRVVDAFNACRTIRGNHSGQFSARLKDDASQS
jgi:hypothetical protein